MNRNSRREVCVSDIFTKLLKASDTSKATIRIPPKSLRADDRDSVKKDKRSSVDRASWKPYPRTR